MNVREELQKLNVEGEKFQFNHVVVNPKTIRAVMINEIVPAEPEDDFYGGTEAAYFYYVRLTGTECGLFIGTDGSYCGCRYGGGEGGECRLGFRADLLLLVYLHLLFGCSAENLFEIPGSGEFSVPARGLL